jgi:hypothetical protein
MIFEDRAACVALAPSLVELANILKWTTESRVDATSCDGRQRRISSLHR